jgi:hypothetical protein
MPASATATTVVTPQGQAATPPLATTVSGASVAVNHTVAFDSVHAGAITVAFGTTSKLYDWGTSTLTEGSIYTFPSSFTFDGSANGYGSIYSLKAGSPGALQLAFAGGDLLHSGSVAEQVSYVKYTQGATTTEIPAGALACYLPGTVSVASLTPVDTSAMTLRVQLKGPDGELGGEIVSVVPSEQIKMVISASAVLALNNATTGSDYNVLGFAAGRNYGSATSTGSTVTITLNAAAAVTATGAVELYVGGALVVGGVAAYTVAARKIEVASMTLGSTTGSLEFRVKVTAPLGTEEIIKTSGHTVYAVPNTVSVSIAGGDAYKLVASYAADTQLSFTHTVGDINSALGAVASDFASGASAGLLTAKSEPVVDVELKLQFAEAGVLGATITARAVEQHALTFTFSRTQTRISCVIPATEIYAFPSSCSHRVVAVSGLGKVDINQQAKCTVAFQGGSALVPSGATHALTVPADETTYWSVVGGDDTPTGGRKTTVEYSVTPLKFPQAGATASFRLGFAGTTRSYTLADVFTTSTVTSGWENIPAPPTGGLQIHVSATAPIISSVLQNLAVPSKPGRLSRDPNVGYVGGKVALMITPIQPTSTFSISMIIFPIVAIRTISIMFFISTLPSSFKNPALLKTFVDIDGGHFIYPRVSFIGNKFSEAVAYLNGAPGRPLSECMGPFNAVSSGWQRLTIVSQATWTGEMHMEDMYINIGRWLVYDRALSDAECRAL